jgi:hypothetical protein
VPPSKDRTQSHLHSQQLNAKSMSNSTRGLPALHSTTALITYDHRAGSPCNGSFKSTSPVVSQAGAQNVSKEDLRPSSVSPTQLALSAKKTYDHPVCPPRNGLTSSPHQRFVSSGPFQGQQLPGCVRVTTAENSGVSP